LFSGIRILIEYFLTKKNIFPTVLECTMNLVNSELKFICNFELLEIEEKEKKALLKGISKVGLY